MTAAPVHSTIDTPIGPLRLHAEGDRLLGVCMDPCVHGGDDVGRHRGVLAVAAQQLEEYFTGSRRTFDLPLEPRGTRFQLAVWDALTRIPYGETASYGKIAAEVGNPRASRAVGGANHNNPLPIVVPCHRVIGASGALTGFGGGLDRKSWLLEHERAVLRAAGRG